jgi:hypothetical protein
MISKGMEKIIAERRHQRLAVITDRDGFPVSATDTSQVYTYDH